VRQVTFLPLAALYGHNIKDIVAKEHCPWYDGESLFQVRKGKGFCGMPRNELGIGVDKYRPWDDGGAQFRAGRKGRGAGPVGGV
jgi:hypothetical protein